MAANNINDKIYNKFIKVDVENLLIMPVKIINNLLPDFVICGKPADLDSEDEAIINEDSFLPSEKTFTALITAL